MILSRRDGRIRVVRQVDHQDQCAAMAALWGDGEFSLPSHAGALALAVAVHDEGWRRWEERPRVGADGAPLDFTALEVADHLAIHGRSIAAAAAADPRAGLLVSLHTQGLYERRRGLDPGPVPPRDEREPALRRFLDDQDALQRRLRVEIGAGSALGAWEWCAYRLLQAWDLLSLFLTWNALADGREVTLARVPRHEGDPGQDLVLRPRGPGEASCAPWPFAAGRVDLPVRGRFVADRRYRSADDLAAALDAAPWSLLEFRLVPG